MKTMTSYLIIAMLTLLGQFASAQEERIELGLGSGNSNVLASSTFKDQSEKGDAQTYWLAYGLDPNWSLELGLDSFDFDKVTTSHQAVTVSGVYRFMADKAYHPIAKFGFGTVDTKASNGDKTNSLGAKLTGAFEYEFKFVSIGAGVNYHYISKVGAADSAKNAQTYTPFLFLTFHMDLADSDADSDTTVAE